MHGAQGGVCSLLPSLAAGHWHRAHRREVGGRRPGHTDTDTRTGQPVRSCRSPREGGVQGLPPEGRGTRFEQGSHGSPGPRPQAPRPGGRGAALGAGAAGRPPDGWTDRVSGACSAGLALGSLLAAAAFLPELLPGSSLLLPRKPGAGSHGAPAAPAGGHTAGRAPHTRPRPPRLPATAPPTPGHSHPNNWPRRPRTPSHGPLTPGHSHPDNRHGPPTPGHGAPPTHGHGPPDTWPWRRASDRPATWDLGHHILTAARPRAVHPESPPAPGGASLPEVPWPPPQDARNTPDSPTPPLLRLAAGGTPCPSRHPGSHSAQLACGADPQLGDHTTQVTPTPRPLPQAPTLTFPQGPGPPRVLEAG